MRRVSRRRGTKREALGKYSFVKYRHIESALCVIKRNIYVRDV